MNTLSFLPMPSIFLSPSFFETPSSLAVKMDRHLKEGNYSIGSPTTEKAQLFREFFKKEAEGCIFDHIPGEPERTIGANFLISLKMNGVFYRYYPRPHNSHLIYENPNADVKYRIDFDFPLDHVAPLSENYVALNTNRQVWIYSVKDQQFLYTLPTIAPKYLLFHENLLYILDLQGIRTYDFSKSMNIARKCAESTKKISLVQKTLMISYFISNMFGELKKFFKHTKSSGALSPILISSIFIGSLITLPFMVENLFSLRTAATQGIAIAIFACAQFAFYDMSRLPKTLKSRSHDALEYIEKPFVIKDPDSTTYGFDLNH